MASFVYTGKDRSGRKISSVISARDEADALNKLRFMSIQVRSLKAGSAESKDG